MSWRLLIFQPTRASDGATDAIVRLASYVDLAMLFQGFAPVN
jgi:hypothetical protein